MPPKTKYMQPNTNNIRVTYKLWAALHNQIPSFCRARHMTMDVSKRNSSMQRHPNVNAFGLILPAPSCIPKYIA